MAIYHLSAKPVRRGAGRSATAAAAYRAGAEIADERTGITFDYTRKQGVEHSEIVLPTAAARPASAKLFVYVTNHGIVPGIMLWDFNGNGKADIATEVLTHAEMSTWTANCKVCKNYFVMDQCCSGGFIGPLTNAQHPKTAIYTAANAVESSWNSEYLDRWLFTYSCNSTMTAMHQLPANTLPFINHFPFGPPSHPQMGEGTVGNGNTTLCKCCAFCGKNQDFCNNTSQIANGIEIVVKGVFNSVVAVASGLWNFTLLPGVPNATSTTLRWTGQIVPPGGTTHVGYTLEDDSCIVLAVHWLNNGNVIGCPILLSTNTHTIGFVTYSHLDNCNQSVTANIVSVVIEYYTIAPPLLSLNDTIVRNPIHTDSLPIVPNTIPFNGNLPLAMPIPPPGATWAVIVTKYGSSGSQCVDKDFQLVAINHFPSADIPTITQWGIIIFALLMLALTMIFVYKKQHALLLADGTNAEQSSLKLFDAKLYLKVAVILLLISSLAMVVIAQLTEPINATDKFGTIASALIVAYMVHLWRQMKKN